MRSRSAPLTDLAYTPLARLSRPDFYVEAAVNAGLTIGLAAAGRYADALWPAQGCRPVGGHRPPG